MKVKFELSTNCVLMRCTNYPAMLFNFRCTNYDHDVISMYLFFFSLLSTISLYVPPSSSSLCTSMYFYHSLPRSQFSLSLSLSCTGRFYCLPILFLYSPSLPSLSSSLYLYLYLYLLFLYSPLFLYNSLPVQPVIPVIPVISPSVHVSVHCKQQFHQCFRGDLKRQLEIR